MRASASMDYPRRRKCLAFPGGTFMSLRLCAAALAAPLLLLCPVLARAASVDEAGEALGRKLGEQLTAKKAKVKAIALSAFVEGPGVEAGAGARAADAVGRGLLAAGVSVKSRDAVAAAVGEQKLAAAQGDEKALGALQKVVAASAVLTGGVNAGGGTLELTAKVIDAEKGVVLATDNAKADAPPVVVASVQKGEGEAREPAPVEAVSGATVEVALRRLADRLASSLQRSLPEQGRYSRIAISTFSETGTMTSEKQLGKLVPSELSTYLVRDHGFLLVERAQLTAVLAEAKLGALGFVEESEAPQLGKLAGAQAVIIGQVSEAGDRFLVSARVVETETGRILAAENGSVPAAGLVALSSDAVVLRSTTDAVYRSLLLPGWGQFYNREPVKGAVFASAEVAALGSALAFHLLGSTAESEYADATPESLGVSPAEASAEAVSLRETAESRYQTRNVLLAVAGGLWAYNVLDAWMNGVDGEAMIGKEGMAVTPREEGGALVFSLP